MAEIAFVKRVLENWEADESFRLLLESDPSEATRRLGVPLDGEDLRPLWKVTPPTVAVHPAVQRYRAFVGEKIAHRDELRRTSRPHSREFHAWRTRQMIRTTSQLGGAKSHGIVHPLAAFELSRGCSVGCWFCGVSAPKLSDHFAYSERNRGLWRDVCAAWRETIGPACTQAFLYWATDPIDNPDYEKFACDFHEVCGYFPQTTTALPLRDAERTRALLRLSEERGCLLNRFSILSLGVLKRVHQTFSAPELAFVEMIMQMSKATDSKAVTGRALERALKQGESDYTTSTIACISGFLVNMLDGTIKLVSPCPASARWPLGYRVYAQGHFHNAQEFAAQLQRMTSPQSLPSSVGGLRRVALREGLTWRVSDETLHISSPYLRQTFTGLPAAKLEKLAVLVSQGHLQAGEVALKLDADLATVFFVLNRMLSVGVLEELEFEPVGV